MYNFHLKCNLLNIAPEIRALTTKQAVSKAIDCAHARACGKAIIIGEHAVLYGTKSVAIPLPGLEVNITIDLSPLQERTPLQSPSYSTQLTKVLADGCRLLRFKEQAFNLQGRSNLLSGAGLGSSAALSVAILRSLSCLQGKPLGRLQLSQLGRQLEHHFHGNSSGLDTTVVAFEQPILFANKQLLKTLTLKKPWHFVLIDSQQRTLTCEMVAKTAPFFKGKKGQSYLQAIDQLATIVAQGFCSGSHQQVGTAMTEANSILKHTGIITSQLSKIITTCNNFKCLGAKVTGSGGGGCVIALLDNKIYQKQLRLLQAQYGPQRVFLVSF